VLERGRFSLVPADDLRSVHRTELGGAMSACDVRQTGVGVHQSGLDLVCGPVVQPVTMDHVGDLESGQSDVANAFELQVRIVVTNLLANVREHPVALALADVERLAVPRIDQPVHVGLELLRNFRWERRERAGHRTILAARLKPI
jgi:hypothetical protein